MALLEVGWENGRQVEKHRKKQFKLVLNCAIFWRPSGSLELLERLSDHPFPSPGRVGVCVHTQPNGKTVLFPARWKWVPIRCGSVGFVGGVYSENGVFFNGSRGILILLKTFNQS